MLDCSYNFISVDMLTVYLPLFLLINAVNSRETDFIQYKIDKNKLGLPIITLCGQHQFLLDTGSQQVWLADSSCSQCSKTLSLCPQLTSSTLLQKQFIYFKGKIRGDFTFINTCLGYNKVVCVKESENMNNIESHGILGFKGQSTGRDFMEELLKMHEVQVLSVGLYYGRNEGKVFLGGIPQSYKGKKLLLGTTNNWTYFVSELLLPSNRSLRVNSTVYFDTGSNILILSTKIYLFLLSQIETLMMQNGCYQTISSLQFKCLGLGLDFKRAVAFKLNDCQEPLIISLEDMLTFEGSLVNVMMDQIEDNVCILGLPVFRSHLVNFHMDGSLQIYQGKRQQLMEFEQSNYNALIWQYMLLVVFSSFLVMEVTQIIDDKINRKIVI